MRAAALEIDLRENVWQVAFGRKGESRFKLLTDIVVQGFVGSANYPRSSPIVRTRCVDRNGSIDVEVACCDSVVPLSCPLSTCILRRRLESFLRFDIAHRPDEGVEIIMCHCRRADNDRGVDIVRAFRTDSVHSQFRDGYVVLKEFGDAKSKFRQRVTQCQLIEQRIGNYQ